MAKDAFGREISFGTRILVGKMRRDGKYPVKFVFASTGSRIDKLMIKDQIDDWIQKERRRGTEPDVAGYTKPPKTQAQLDADIAEALAERED